MAKEEVRRFQDILQDMKEYLLDVHDGFVSGVGRDKQYADLRQYLTDGQFRVCLLYTSPSPRD